MWVRIRMKIKERKMWLSNITLDKVRALFLGHEIHKWLLVKGLPYQPHIEIRGGHIIEGENVGTCL